MGGAGGQAALGPSESRAREREEAGKSAEDCFPGLARRKALACRLGAGSGLIRQAVASP